MNKNWKSLELLKIQKFEIIIWKSKKIEELNGMECIMIQLKAANKFNNTININFNDFIEDKKLWKIFLNKKSYSLHKYV